MTAKRKKTGRNEKDRGFDGRALIRFGRFFVFFVRVRAVGFLYFVPVGERLVHRHFVDELEIGTDRHAHRNARHAHAERF